jgi:hypothetical protein
LEKGGLSNVFQIPPPAPWGGGRAPNYDRDYYYYYYCHCCYD